MSALLNDTFADADGTDLAAHTMDVGGPWAALGGAITTRSNRAVPAGTGVGYYAADAGAVDYTATLTVHTGSGDSACNLGFVFRAADAANYWIAILNGSINLGVSAQIFEVVGGAFTQRDSQPVSVSAGSSVPLEIDVAGTSVTFKANGSAVASYGTMGTGGTRTQVGIWLRNTDSDPGVWADDFLVAGGAGGPNYTLTAAQASFTLTGESAGLLAGRKLAATQASYTLTGEATGLVTGRKLVAVQASYTLTGQATALKAGRVLVALTATYALTGEAAGLRAGRVLTVGTGGYTLTGEAVGLTYTPAGGPTYTLATAAGSFALTGEAAALVAARRLTTAAGAVSLTGTATGLVAGRRLATATGTLAITGEAAGLVVSRDLVTAAGAFTLTGFAATLRYSGTVAEIVTPGGTFRRAAGLSRIFRRTAGLSRVFRGNKVAILLNTFPKGPGEVREWIADYSRFDEILAGEVIVSASVSVSPSGLSLGTAEVLDAATNFVPAGQGVGIPVSGGTVGQSYVVSCLAMTDGGSVLEERVQINVE